MTREKLIRRAAGSYVTVDGRYSIIKSDWDGPQGGLRTLWEIAEPDEWSGWVVGRYPPGQTLREAREHLANIRQAEASS